jgi:hypothetical protein
MARRQAEAHAISQFSERKPAIGVQFSKNLSVNSIH